jgi:hypothetical protein
MPSYGSALRESVEDSAPLLQIKQAPRVAGLIGEGGGRGRRQQGTHVSDPGHLDAHTAQYGGGDGGGGEGQDIQSRCLGDGNWGQEGGGGGERGDGTQSPGCGSPPHYSQGVGGAQPSSGLMHITSHSKAAKSGLAGDMGLGGLVRGSRASISTAAPLQVRLVAFAGVLHTQSKPKSDALHTHTHTHT